jgi:hypothetical protein
MIESKVEGLKSFDFRLETFDIASACDLRPATYIAQ